jgi:hypothetical protein
MSDNTDANPSKPASDAPPARPAHQPRSQSVDRPQTARLQTAPNDYEEIPVEELVRLTRELTQRITDADRQRLAEELQSTGHQRSIQTKGPLTLQQFFTGEIDLDTELAYRFANAPLMSSMSVNPRKITSLTRRASTIFTSQDGSTMLNFDVELYTGRLEATFTAYSMLSFRFGLGFIEKSARQRWIDLMRRNSGIAFLWTKERWESDYLIFVVREYFTRVYAFSPQRFEAAVRMTPDTVEKMVNWFEAHWLRNETEEETRSSKQKKPPALKALRDKQKAPPTTDGAASKTSESAPANPTSSSPEKPVATDTPDKGQNDDGAGDESEADASTFEW